MRHIFVQDKLAPADKCRMLGPGSACGIDISAQQEIIDKGSFKQVLGISPASFIALYVGRPHRRKGFDAILATWAQTFKDANAVLLLAGIGTEDVLRVLPDLPANIRPLGYLADLSPYYAAADVVVLPSEHEGFGYSLLEGASYGCCLIASRIPGPDAIVQDGANGFLIQVGDSKALATSLLRLVHDPDLCRQLGANARMSAEKFERAEILALYGKYMRSILGIKN
jgi:glycosyltransferase involved in cell wall biosynthesis